MAQFDLHTRTAGSSALNIQLINSDTTTAGNIIDMQDAHALEFVLFSATLTTGVFTPLIQHGEDAALGDAETVTSDFLLGTIADATFGVADDNSVKKIGYIGKKRYVRLNIVTTSTGNGTIGAVAIKGHPGIASIDANT